MADIFSQIKRSEIMAHVRSKETKPEITIRKFLFSKGFRYRKNVKSLPGTPDIVLSKYKTVIFVNGCFWHGHKDCKAATLPKTRIEFWTLKITSNIERDSKKQKVLKEEGWKVIIIWQCEIKQMISEVQESSKLINHIRSLNKK